VQRFEFIGDTDGSEAGTRTRMAVTFNPLRFELTEVGNCVTQSEVSRLRSLGLIAPETLEQLESSPPPPGSARGSSSYP
jgi:hypothetical protein